MDLTQIPDEELRAEAGRRKAREEPPLDEAREKLVAHAEVNLKAGLEDALDREISEDQMYSIVLACRVFEEATS
jgi:hypothetical protein